MTASQVTPHETVAESAHQIWRWLQERGGIIVWESQDMGNPGQSVTTPYRSADGSPAGSPGWRYPTPTRHITDPADVVVLATRVLKTVPVRISRADGFRLIVANSSVDKLGRMVEKLRREHPTAVDIWWVPTGDILDHTADIVICDRTVPLADYIAANPAE